MPSSRRILLTGATGYIGGRLLGRLESEGELVRCLARRPEFVRRGPDTEVVGGDLLKPETLPKAMRDIECAYYLVHSMASPRSFAEQDRTAATHFVDAARRAGVKRIVYLGGLGSGDTLSGHLESRQEVGRILRESGIPTLELQASIIIGSGSLSFEMIRALVEKLPVMVTPRWVRTLAQPIAVEDVIEYLVAARESTLEGIVQIGGADRASYQDIMREYARQRGLRRWTVAVPVLTPRLSSLWLGLVTPVYARIGRQLLDGLRNETVVEDTRAVQQFAIRPRGLAASIERALTNEDREFAETRWSDALSSSGGGESNLQRVGARIVDSRSRWVQGDPAAAFAPIRRIGGDSGWYAGNLLWRLRGFADLLLGGPGSRRGRRNPEQLRVGDTLDFWRVEAFVEDRLLRLSAEMRLPGRAWLQFETRPERSGCMIRQTAEFEPLGLTGLAYWYALYPLHRWIFSRMLEGIADRSAVK